MEVAPGGEEAMREAKRERIKQELREELRRELREDLRVELLAESNKGGAEQAESPKPQRARARKQSSLRAQDAEEVLDELQSMPGDAVPQTESLQVASSSKAQTGEPDPRANEAGEEGAVGGLAPQFQTITLEELDYDWKTLGTMEEETVKGLLEIEKAGKQLGLSMSRNRSLGDESSGLPPSPSLIPRRVSVEQVGGLGSSLHQRLDHSGDKKGNWLFIPLRPILIVGDSNISRVPQFDDERIQLVAYPDAKLSNICWTLQHRTPKTPETQLVVLSFGINDRASKTIESLEKMVKGAFKNTTGGWRLFSEWTPEIREL